MVKFSQMASVALAGLGSCAVVLEQMPEVPRGWTLINDSVDPAQPLRMSIFLREPTIDEIRVKLNDPSAPQLTREEANALRAPDWTDVDGVKRWLGEHGIPSFHWENDMIHIHTDVGKAESLLGMKMRRYDFQGKGPVLRTTQYSVPEELQEAISFIHPIANFMAPKKELSRLSPVPAVMRRGDVPCNKGSTPECIRKLYNMPPINATAESSVRLGIAGFLEEYANYRDVSTFLGSYAPMIRDTGYNFSVELVNGGENPQGMNQSGTEAALDVEYAMALGFPSNVTYYSTGGRGVKLDDRGHPLDEEYVDNEPYLEFFEHLLNKSDSEIPHVVSLSYADDELSVPQPYAERVCSMIGLLAGRGTTVLGGSGDGGSAGARDSSCVAADGRPVTMAVFPASCPWVTAVGAVTNDMYPVRGADFSGGGFSQYFVREAWQDAAVNSYAHSLGTHLQGYYNSSMRATPDISVVGTSFQTVFGMQVAAVDGTSASTPVMAAMVALVNDARLKAGKGLLGWLNGKLYTDAVRRALHDVEHGSSMSCSFKNESQPGAWTQPGGWPAAGGWDAITGLGVPRDFESFLKALVDA